MAVHIALVEDNGDFAHALSRYFQLTDRVRLVATFPSAEKVLLSLRDLSVAVLLVDINLPGIQGTELVAKIKESRPEILCLILTMYEETALIFEALKAGACGYILKRTPPGEIVSAIEQVAQGGSPMSPQIARQVVSFFHTPPPHSTASALSPLPPTRADQLSENENKVLELLVKGLLYKEISDSLGITIDMVRNRIRKIYEKLHVHSRTDAVVKYLAQRK